MMQDSEQPRTTPTSLDAQGHQAPSDALLEPLRDALGHLYDYAYLEGHALGSALGLDAGLEPREAMRALRTLLLGTIEAMNPGPSASFRSQPARSYNVLNLHYVEGFTIQEVGRELALSERQIYRELRRAEADLAALLLFQQPQLLSRAELVHQEAERIGEDVAPVDVVELVQGALEAVERLAGARQVRLQVGPPPAGCPSPERVLSYPLLARQALVSTLSYAIQQAPPASDVRLQVEQDKQRALVEVTFVLPCEPTGDEGSPEGPRLPADTQHLVRWLGGGWGVEATRQGESRFRVSFELGERLKLTVLVIDDHEGLVELFRRYLPEGGYRLVSASDGREGLALAHKLLPDVVILDVMMPEQDGWEVLQTLQHRMDTRAIPVIVCSVLEDPELAMSLGASAFLSKPVSRDQLLAALEPHRPGIRPLSHPTTRRDSAPPPTG